jgi:hypothetical protein
MWRQLHFPILRLMCRRTFGPHVFIHQHRMAMPATASENMAPGRWTSQGQWIAQAMHPKLANSIRIRLMRPMTPSLTRGESTAQQHTTNTMSWDAA